MINDPNLLVTVSKRNNHGVWQVFVTNWQDRLIFGLRQFAKSRPARVYAQDLAMRWSPGASSCSRSRSAWSGVAEGRQRQQGTCRGGFWEGNVPDRKVRLPCLAASRTGRTTSMQGQDPPGCAPQPAVDARTRFDGRDATIPGRLRGRLDRAVRGDSLGSSLAAHTPQDVPLRLAHPLGGGAARASTAEGQPGPRRFQKPRRRAGPLGRVGGDVPPPNRARAWRWRTGATPEWACVDAARALDSKGTP